MVSVLGLLALGVFAGNASSIYRIDMNVTQEGLPAQVAHLSTQNNQPVTYSVVSNDRRLTLKVSPSALADDKINLALEASVVSLDGHPSRKTTTTVQLGDDRHLRIEMPAYEGDPAVHFEIAVSSAS